MKKYSVKKLVLNSLMIALVFLATYFSRIPTPLPGGYFNLGDAVVMLAAVFLGPVAGMAAGAIGSCLADLAAAAFIFAPATFVVKGLEGLVVGLLAAMSFRKKASGQNAFSAGIIVSVVTGAIFMVAGYFVAEAFLLGFFGEGFGLTAAIAELLPNLIQGGLSAVLSYILIVLLGRMDIGKYIQ